MQQNHRYHLLLSTHFSSSSKTGIYITHKSPDRSQRFRCVMLVAASVQQRWGAGYRSLLSFSLHLNRMCIYSFFFFFFHFQTWSLQNPTDSDDSRDSAQLPLETQKAQSLLSYIQRYSRNCPLCQLIRLKGCTLNTVIEGVHGKNSILAFSYAFKHLDSHSQLENVPMSCQKYPIVCFHEHGGKMSWGITPTSHLQMLRRHLEQQSLNNGLKLVVCISTS